MSWTFSRALVAAYLEASSSGGELVAPSKSTPTAETDSCSGKTKGIFNHSQYGMTYEPSTGGLGEDVLTWFVAASHARTSAAQEQEKALVEVGADSGGKWPESFARWDQNTLSWRTPQCSLLADLDTFSGIWPRWGMMLNGACYPLPMPSGLSAIRGLITYANGSGSLPTLTVHGNYNRKGASKSSGDGLHTALRLQTLVADDSVNRAKGKFNSRGEAKLSGWAGGPLNPTWCEWFMGFPMGWTASEPLATDRFQQWLRSHGAFLDRNETL